MQSKKLGWGVLFAISMAYFESAVVVYLRRLGNINDLMVSKPLLDSQIGAIEVGREAASLVMLLAVGWLAGKKLQSRLSFSIIIFGLWDIFYYVFLKVFIDWPASIMDPDILFLIPLPWWGPVLAPVMISLLMITAGVFMIFKEDQGIPVHLMPADWVLLLTGVLTMLYTFMVDAIKALPADAQALGQLRPTLFHWPIFILGLGLVSVFVWRLAILKSGTTGR